MASEPSWDRDAVIRRIVAASQVVAGPSAAPDLTAVAREIGDGAGLRDCRIAPAARGPARQDVGDPFRDAIRWSGWSAETAGAGDWLPPPGMRIHEVRFAGELVGWWAFSAPLIMPVGPRRRILKDILVVLGPILDAAGLAATLRRELDAVLGYVEETASARRRTVARMDEQRRVLERNLHDGAQHHLVNLRLTVGLIEHQMAVGNVEAVARQLGTLAEQIAQAEGVLYDAASGILPVSLLSGGLCHALESEIGGQEGITLRLPEGPARRYPRVVETAVFYACLEAVTNARKHAPGAGVTVTLSDTYQGLRFSVRDDGPGFDPATRPPDSGLGRLSDRVGAVGGAVTVYSTPGMGTEVEGVVPI
ncbi:sensor histidine kinase [Micromonospora craniellae]|uniref:Histidine kinase/HSP90-like ATPase domain-containing protein n=1 Tax=Micromonospora craniellae TaxID=2294034 RepID=A0A372FRE5_9ACTN|nr:ATP-binding protein [Micromonospora craniellae]QOC92253.1 ATP-binding protein [Micromonospora craniellae]RFS41001.1 hypothetical protein D0Q02_29870 [Micromonospora craniellae]